MRNLFSFVTDLNGALCLFRSMLMDVIAAFEPRPGVIGMLTFPHSLLV